MVSNPQLGAKANARFGVRRHVCVRHRTDSPWRAFKSGPARAGSPHSKSRSRGCSVRCLSGFRVGRPDSCAEDSARYSTRAESSSKLVRRDSRSPSLGRAAFTPHVQQQVYGSVQPQGDRCGHLVRIIFKGLLVRPSCRRETSRPRGAAPRLRKREREIQNSRKGISDENTNETQASQSSIATVDPLRRRRCNFSGRMCRGAVRGGV